MFFLVRGVDASTVPAEGSISPFSSAQAMAGAYGSAPPSAVLPEAGPGAP